MRFLYIFAAIVVAGCIDAPPAGSAADGGGGDTGVSSDGDPASDLDDDDAQSSTDTGGSSDVTPDVADVADVSSDTRGNEEDAGSEGIRIPITVPADNVPATLEDFPLLVTLEHDALISDTRRGAELSFTDAMDGTLVHDVEAYSRQQGKLVSWVLIPRLEAGSDTTIYLVLEQRANSQPDVWKDYAAVWHLQSIRNDGAFHDRTSNNNHAASMGDAEARIAKIGRGVSLDGSTQFLEADDSGSLQPAEFTVSLWLKLDSIDGVTTVISRPYGDMHWNSYQIYVASDRVVHTWVTHDGQEFWDGELSIPLNTWVYLAYTYDGSEVLQYIDGEATRYQVSGAVTYDPHNVLIGADRDGGGVIGHVAGQIDEARIATQALPLERLQTEHLNQSDPGAFYTVGMPESF